MPVDGRFKRDVYQCLYGEFPYMHLISFHLRHRHPSQLLQLAPSLLDVDVARDVINRSDHGILYDKRLEKSADDRMQVRATSMCHVSVVCSYLLMLACSNGCATSIYHC